MYTKECPSCSKELIYKNDRSYKHSVRKNSLCYACAGTTFTSHGKYEEIPYTWFRHKESEAKRRELDFTITIEDVWNVYQEQGGLCAISGLPIEWHKDTARMDRGHTVSIDRTDSDGGYTLDNIQLVHKQVNIMKMDLSMDEFLCFIKHISNWNGLNF